MKNNNEGQFPSWQHWWCPVWTAKFTPQRAVSKQFRSVLSLSCFQLASTKGKAGAKRKSACYWGMVVSCLKYSLLQFSNYRPVPLWAAHHSYWNFLWHENSGWWKPGSFCNLRSTEDVQLNAASVFQKHLQMLDPACLVQHKPCFIHKLTILKKD